MSDPITRSFKELIETYEKAMEDIERNIYKVRRALQRSENTLLFLDPALLEEQGIHINPTLLMDTFEVSWDDNILQILIYDIPPRYKVTNNYETIYWRELISNAVYSLEQEPHFEQAFIWFEFYVPDSVAIKADTDNRMVKTIINALVTTRVIPDDTMNHMAFGCIGFPIDNPYPKTVIKVTDLSNMYKIISAQPSSEIANKEPVKSEQLYKKLTDRLPRRNEQEYQKEDSNLQESKQQKYQIDEEEWL